MRTLIAPVMPVVGFGDSGYLTFASAPEATLLTANLNSFVLDWVTRQKIGGTNLNLFLVEQLPVLAPASYQDHTPWAPVQLGDWVRRYIVELVATPSSLLPFANDCGWSGPPFRWDPRRRSQLRAELDAAFFRVYGMSRIEAEHVLNSFWVVRDRDMKEHGCYRTRELILDAYDRISEASADRPFTSLLDPPPGDPRAAHPPRPGEPPGRWLPWSEVMGRTPCTPASANLPRQPAAPATTARMQERDPETRPVPARSGSTPSLPFVGRERDWLPETATSPHEILMGMGVRHRSRGTGTILAVNPTGKGAELLIRFDAGGEAWMVFGLGLLEFGRANPTGS